MQKRTREIITTIGTPKSHSTTGTVISLAAIKRRSHRDVHNGVPLQLFPKTRTDTVTIFVLETATNRKRNSPYVRNRGRYSLGGKRS